MGDYVAEELQEARDALADAKKFQQIDVTDKALVNRLYYACFHAAKAVLYAKGLDPSTHQGVVSLFGEEVVLADDASREDGRFLTRLRDLREQADYAYEPIQADIDRLIDRTEAFVADMEEIV